MGPLEVGEDSGFVVEDGMGEGAYGCFDSEYLGGVKG